MHRKISAAMPAPTSSAHGSDIKCTCYIRFLGHETEPYNVCRDLLAECLVWRAALNTARAVIPRTYRNLYHWQHETISKFLTLVNWLVQTKMSMITPRTKNIMRTEIKSHLLKRYTLSRKKKNGTSKLIFFFSLVFCNVEVPQLINISVFVGRNDSQPIPHIMLLQVLLCKVLQISTTNKAKIYHPLQ